MNLTLRVCPSKSFIHSYLWGCNTGGAPWASVAVQPANTKNICI